MYKYYIIRQNGEKKEIYGVVSETQRYITTDIINKQGVSKKKNVVIDKETITKNISQFDFTTSIQQ